MATTPTKPADASDDAAIAEAARIEREIELDIQRKRWALRATQLTEAGIYIVSKIPGFRRAGIEHTGFKRYPLDAFTGSQLALLQSETNIELFTIGGEAIPRSGDVPATLAGHNFVDGDVRGRALEAAIAEQADAADAGIKGRAARDLARETTRNRR